MPPGRADIAHTPLPTLVRGLGEATGHHLHELSWGRDPRTVQREQLSSRFALALIGIDGLTDDLLTPGAEATVLRAVTSRLTRALRGEDWLARGKDGDFVVLVDGTIAQAETVAARLVAAVGPVPTSAGPVRLTAVAGVPVGSGSGLLAWLPAAIDHEAVLRDIAEGLDVVIDRAMADNPGVEVKRHVLDGTGAELLTEFSTATDLIVVGSRGRGGFAGLLLGSTSQAVLHHSACPVMVVTRRCENPDQPPRGRVQDIGDLYR